jgi:hypothetical protein
MRGAEEKAGVWLSEMQALVTWVPLGPLLAERDGRW